MSMKKWSAKELFEMFETEVNVEEIKELYKALLAREVGVVEYTDEVDEVLTEGLEEDYYRNNAIASFIDEELVDNIWDRCDAKNISINIRY